MMKGLPDVPPLAAENAPTRGEKCPHSRRKEILLHGLLGLIEQSSQYTPTALSLTRTRKESVQGTFLQVLLFQMVRAIRAGTERSGEQRENAMKRLSGDVGLHRTVNFGIP